MVALTTFAWLLEPRDLASTSLMPAASTTARTPPPAMTPVPGEAGLSSTRPPPYSPMTSCGMVLSRTATLTRDFLADSEALRMASETSFALPKPKPTLPARSPATMRALKEKRRPPFTTLAHRLMNTTFSLNSDLSEELPRSLLSLLLRGSAIMIKIPGLLRVPHPPGLLLCRGRAIRRDRTRLWKCSSPCCARPRGGPPSRRSPCWRAFSCRL